jgi:coenzyme F420-dependent glucose-6-phosphate dehydrogenase
MATAKIGYALSSEEHTPNDLVRHAHMAEEAGFTFALISDHFHPWVDAQGHSPFVWSVLGAIAHATERLELGTGVTCPTIRIHPAIIAQAAATVAAMMPGRFFLGVGTGENLNEHVLGDRWPPHDLRLEMLEESIAVIRQLWKGGSQSHHGKHYTVENARIYTLPEELPPIIVAASGPRAAAAAGRFGDGLCSTAPETEIITAFTSAGGNGPRYGQMTVCWASSETEAKRTALKIWPNAALGGELSQELPTPAHFEQATSAVTEEQIAKEVVCGPDPQQHVDLIKKYIEAGFDHVYIHQVGPDQAGFINFYQREVLPQFK